MYVKHVSVEYGWSHELDSTPDPERLRSHMGKQHKKQVRKQMKKHARKKAQK